MGDAHADALGLVGAVDQVAGDAQAHLARAHGVVGSGRHHAGQGVAGLGVFAANGGGGIPGRILDHLGDGGGAQRRLPVHAAHGDRVGLHRTRLAFLGRGVVVEAHLGHVDHDAVARCIGQDELGRDGHFGTLAGIPDADVGVGAGDGVEADAVLVSDIDEGVFLVGFDGVDLTDQVAFFGQQVVAPGQVVGRRQRCRQRAHNATQGGEADEWPAK